MRDNALPMPHFHHLWVVDVELEIANPAPDAEESCGERIFGALSRYASEDVSPYPASVVRSDDCWLEVTFPVWAPSRFAALSAGAAVLAEVCAYAEAQIAVVRLAVGESAEELHGYRHRMRDMEQHSETSA
jgi:hypothetical protein